MKDNIYKKTFKMLTKKTKDKLYCHYLYYDNICLTNTAITFIYWYINR